MVISFGAVKTKGLDGSFYTMSSNKKVKVSNNQDMAQNRGRKKMTIRYLYEENRKPRQQLFSIDGLSDTRT